MGQHIVVHSRVNTDETEFIGSEAYEEYVRLDNEPLHASYKDPVPARTSLIFHDDGIVPVGDITSARFLSSGRLLAPSSQPELSNSDTAMSEMNPHSSSEQPTVEWVKPELKLDKNRAEPVAFSTKSGLNMRTGWERWEAKEDGTGRLFVCVPGSKGGEYWAEHLPGEWVKPAWDRLSEKPLIQFHNNAGELIQTTRTKWLPGQGNSFFAYLRRGTAYLTTARLPEPGIAT